MEKTLVERLQDYAKKSYKTPTQMADEMKFKQGLCSTQKSQATGKIYGQAIGKSQVSHWLNGRYTPTGKSIEIIEDYLRRMKA